MTRRCWPRKRYYVSLRRFRRDPRGGWSNYIATPSLPRARMANAKLPVKRRQIDVRIRGSRIKPYVLEGSWK